MLKHIESNVKHHIFIGENSLKIAMFFHKNRRCPTSEELYRWIPEKVNGVSFSGQDDMLVANPKVHISLDRENIKSHAKMYLYEGGTFLSSQNFTNTPNVEFTVYYPEKAHSIRGFISEAIAFTKLLMKKKVCIPFVTRGKRNVR